MPVSITMDGKYDHPNVFVDGDPATNLQYLDYVDNVDPSLESDRKINNIVQTSLGVQMKRTIYAFAHPDHQNYHIQEYVFTNNGCFDNCRKNGTFQIVYRKKLKTNTPIEIFSTKFPQCDKGCQRSH